MDVLHHILLADTALVGQRNLKLNVCTFVFKAGSPHLNNINDGEGVELGVAVRPALDERRAVLQQLCLPSLGELPGQVGRVKQGRLEV